MVNGHKHCCNHEDGTLTLRKKLKTPSKKKVSIPRIDEKKFHTREFQLKDIGRNMRCKLLQKGH